MSSSETAPAVPTVGLDIGGTKVLGVLLDADGNVLHEQRRLSPHAGVDALVATAAGDRRGARAAGCSRSVSARPGS